MTSFLSCIYAVYSSDNFAVVILMWEFLFNIFLIFCYFLIPLLLHLRTDQAVYITGSEWWVFFFLITVLLNFYYSEWCFCSSFLWELKLFCGSFLPSLFHEKKIIYKLVPLTLTHRWYLSSYIHHYDVHIFFTSLKKKSCITDIYIYFSRIFLVIYS